MIALAVAACAPAAQEAAVGPPAAVVPMELAAPEPQPAAAPARLTCPAVPESVRTALARPLHLPEQRPDGGRIAGDAIIGDAERARALAEIVHLYERCRGA